MTQVSELERIDIEAENPWGDCSYAVDSAFRFWEWWDSDPDSDMSLSTGSMEANARTVGGLLPEGSDDSMAEDIVNGARLLTMRGNMGDYYRELFNKVLFELSADEDDDMPLIVLGMNDQQLEAEYIRGFRALARLAVNKGEKNG